MMEVEKIKYANSFKYRSKEGGVKERTKKERQAITSITRIMRSVRMKVGREGTEECYVSETCTQHESQPVVQACAEEMSHVRLCKLRWGWSEY